MLQTDETLVASKLISHHDHQDFDSIVNVVSARAVAICYGPV